MSKMLRIKEIKKEFIVLYKTFNGSMIEIGKYKEKEDAELILASTKRCVDKIGVISFEKSLGEITFLATARCINLTFIRNSFLINHASSGKYQVI